MNELEKFKSIIKIDTLEGIEENNTFHPVQINKLTDLDTIKVYYKSMFETLEWDRRNLRTWYNGIMKDIEERQRKDTKLIKDKDIIINKLNKELLELKSI